MKGRFIKEFVINKKDAKFIEKDVSDIYINKIGMKD